MKKISVLGAAVFISLLLASTAFAQAGRWMIGLRAGASIPTGTGHITVTDTDDSTPGKGKLKPRTGPLVNGQIAYWFNELFSLGLSGEWETHKIRTKTVCLEGGCIGDTTDEVTKVGGRIHTVSILPTVMVRPFRSGPFAPYLSLGVGPNINWIRNTPSDQAKTRINNISLAVKPAVGFDWFILPGLALNIEVGWKLNRITGLKTRQVVHDGVSGPVEVGFGKGKIDASEVGILVGFRWYSP